MDIVLFLVPLIFVPNSVAQELSLRINKRQNMVNGSTYRYDVGQHLLANCSSKINPSGDICTGTVTFCKKEECYVTTPYHTSIIKVYEISVNDCDTYISCSLTKVCYAKNAYNYENSKNYTTEYITTFILLKMNELEATDISLKMDGKEKTNGTTEIYSGYTMLRCSTTINNDNDRNLIYKIKLSDEKSIFQYNHTGFRRNIRSENYKDSSYSTHYIDEYYIWNNNYNTVNIICSVEVKKWKNTKWSKVTELNKFITLTRSNKITYNTIESTTSPVSTATVKPDSDKHRNDTKLNETEQSKYGSHNILDELWFKVILSCLCVAIMIAITIFIIKVLRRKIYTKFSDIEIQTINDDPPPNFPSSGTIEAIYCTPIHNTIEPGYTLKSLDELYSKPIPKSERTKAEVPSFHVNNKSQMSNNISTDESGYAELSIQKAEPAYEQVQKGFSSQEYANVFKGIYANSESQS